MRPGTLPAGSLGNKSGGLDMRVVSHFLILHFVTRRENEQN